MMSCKGAHFEKDIILPCVHWYVAYLPSHRQLEELVQERGVSVVHATINRWVLKYSPYHSWINDATPLLLRMMSSV